MDFFTLFLSAFAELANRVSNLEKSKLQDRKDLFNNIIDPLFKELEPAAENYVKFFRQARELIKKASRRNMQDVTYHMLQVREEMALTRIKVREMAAQIKERIEDKEVLSFTKAVNDFFYHTPDLPLPEMEYALTRSETIMVFMRLLEANKITKKEIIQHVDETLSNLEKSWGLIVRSYEKIRIHSISSPKLVRKNIAIKDKN